MQSVSTLPELLDQHAQQLAALVGQRLVQTWIPWDLAEQTRFVDESIVLVFSESALSVAFSKLSDVMLSWDGACLDRPPATVADWSFGFNLEWRQPTDGPLSAVAGSTLTVVEALEQRVDFKSVGSPGPANSVWMLNGLRFWFDKHVLEIFNALDETGIASEPSTGDIFRTATIAARH